MLKLFIIGLMLCSGSASGAQYALVFYCTYQTEDCIDSGRAVELGTVAVSELLELVAAEEENFVGFTDSYGTTLQFFVDDIDSIWMEIPSPDLGGSFGIRISTEEMKKIVGSLKQPYIDYKAAMRMQFRKW